MQPGAKKDGAGVRVRVGVEGSVGSGICRAGLQQAACFPQPSCRGSVHSARPLVGLLSACAAMAWLLWARAPQPPHVAVASVCILVSITCMACMQNSVLEPHLRHATPDRSFLRELLRYVSA